MNGDEMAWMWGAGLIVFAIGLGFGVLVTYLLGGGRRKLREKDHALQEVEAAYTGYREEVDHHFHKTAELFQEMTEQYRSVYEHLANGANALGDSSWQPPMLDLETAPTDRPADPDQNVPEDTIFVAQTADAAKDETPKVGDIDLVQDTAERSPREFH